MPKGHRLIAPGGHADGFRAGVLGGGVIKINRSPALILPVVLERVVIDQLVGMGGSRDRQGGNRQGQVFNTIQVRCFSNSYVQYLRNPSAQ